MWLCGCVVVLINGRSGNHIFGPLIPDYFRMYTENQDNLLLLILFLCWYGCFIRVHNFAHPSPVRFRVNSTTSRCAAWVYAGVPSSPACPSFLHLHHGQRAVLRRPRYRPAVVDPQNRHPLVSPWKPSPSFSPCFFFLHRICNPPS